MNAKEWARIVDLLSQIRIKIRNEEPRIEVNRQRINDSLDYINALLHLTEEMAVDQAGGWF